MGAGSTPQPGSPKPQVNSGHCIFCSLLFVILTAPQPPQSNPNPSFQPVDSIVYHSDHLTLLLTTSMHPFFYRGKSHSAGFSLIPPHPTYCPGPPQPVLIKRGGGREGTIAFGAGQVLHLAHLAPGNKMTVAAYLTPQKMPRATFQMAPNISAGIQPRPRPPPPPCLGTQAHAAPGAWIRGSIHFKMIVPCTSQLHTSYG